MQIGITQRGEITDKMGGLIDALVNAPEEAKEQTLAAEVAQKEFREMAAKTIEGLQQSNRLLREALSRENEAEIVEEVALKALIEREQAELNVLKEQIQTTQEKTAELKKINEDLKSNPAEQEAAYLTFMRLEYGLVLKNSRGECGVM